jgi:S-formylglutathione hydrolase FrmB
MRRRLMVLGVLGALGSAPAALAADATPLQLVSSTSLDTRLSELTFHTPAVSGDTKVRVLVPAGYDASGATRYPVLLLLHGAQDDYRSWTDEGDAEAITAGLRAIVVMPDSGTGGGYTDWYNGGAFGPPAWETYHLSQLLPWIDAHYPTVGTRSGRAVAGLSMGGYGAMEYAARHPDLFAAAAGFSPAVDLTSPPLLVVNQVGDLADGTPSPYGNYVTDEIRTRGKNPVDLAENLAGLDLTLRTGNGDPGGPGGDTGDPVEAEVHEEAVNLHNRLTALGIPHVWDDYGPGGHAWYYWQRDLRQLVPALQRVFAAPPRRPARFDYLTIDPDFQVYGWHVAITRPALEFAELRNAGRGGFDLRGSGTASVTTGRVARPGSTVEALVRSAIATSTATLTADGRGRFTLAVPLGPGNPDQEYSPQATAGAGTTVYTTHVEFRRMRTGA